MANGEMAGRKFRIFWHGGDLVYHPLLGRIDDVRSGDVYEVGKHPGSRFPDFATASLAELRQKYKPVCLTVYLNHRCNLACSYCYIDDKQRRAAAEVDPAAVRAAAEFVAENCAVAASPFVLGFHGGNEPLLNVEMICHCLEICGEVAQKHGVELQAFCTSSGVIPVKTAEWAARTFAGITLSWDGPPYLHDRFRRQADGRPTSPIVRRTAAILANSASLQQLKVRATVTSASVRHLLEIVQYFHEQRVNGIAFHPLFQNAGNSLAPGLLPDRPQFVQHFLRARNWAKEHHIAVGYAGSRLAEFHDKYCAVLQENLTLTPDGYLTCCFLRTDNSQDSNSRFIYGRFDRGSGRLLLDWSKLASLLRRLLRTRPACANCFNYLHCARSCPAVCPLQNQGASPDCTIEKWIGLANILAAANHEIDAGTGKAFFQNVHVEELPRRNEYVRMSDYD